MEEEGLSQEYFIFLDKITSDSTSIIEEYNKDNTIDNKTKVKNIENVIIDMRNKVLKKFGENQEVIKSADELLLKKVNSIEGSPLAKVVSEEVVGSLHNSSGGGIKLDDNEIKELIKKSKKLHVYAPPPTETEGEQLEKIPVVKGIINKLNKYLDDLVEATEKEDPNNLGFFQM